MEDLKVYYKLIENYILNRTEWFWQYKICFLLYILLMDILGLYIFFGNSVVFSFLFLLFKIILAIHIALSMNVVYVDYIYNHSIVFICKSLTFLLIFKCFLITLY